MTLAATVYTSRRIICLSLAFAFLNLTGLPPTPAEVDAFLADTSPNAYEKVVDRLLKSPRYGEHMARFWLDVARYGDTHGLHLDNYREMWPYRDWVIKAFNDNKPYDRFLAEQLAGDLLPNATLDQIVATGFNRCHVTTSEGGSIEEEVYVRNVIDRVDTTGTVFMGLTVGCARCHDHKFDPIKTKEFYQLFAFFDSLDAPALDGNAARPAPTVNVPTAEQKAKLDHLQQEVDQPCYVLIRDLEQRGLLDETLVIWGGEFGRTIYCQGNLTREDYGRDHHPRCFTIWLAGGGIKGGISYGKTDDFSYNVVENPVHIHDLNATILHCLGIDHRRLTFKSQGLDMRLTVVEEHHPVKGILA